MKPIGVLYATREGQTEKIAGHIGSKLTQLGFAADVKNVGHAAAGDLAGYSAVILAASVHGGAHEKEMVQFVIRNREQLNRLPATFLSVTLSQAGVEQKTAPAEQRQASAAGVAEVMNRFFKETSWHPAHTKPVAGALHYSKYNPLVRWVLKFIAKKNNAPTDTSHDYEFTNWVDLDVFVEDLAHELRASGSESLQSCSTPLPPAPRESD